MFLANTFEDDFVKGYCISTYIRTMIRTPCVQFLFALEAALSLLFVFVFHYIRVLENRKIPRGLSTVGIDQVAELNEIRTHKITFLFSIHLPLGTSTASTKSPTFRINLPPICIIFRAN
jgi:hypothetical protein